jgi:hypothetical protein
MFRTQGRGGDFVYKTREVKGFCLQNKGGEGILCTKQRREGILFTKQNIDPPPGITVVPEAGSRLRRVADCSLPILHNKSGIEILHTF